VSNLRPMRAEAHRESLKFDSALGWERGFCSDLIRYPPSLYVHAFERKMESRWNGYLNDRMWEIDLLAYLHDRNDSAGFR
jgi:hypothetical protein